MTGSCPQSGRPADCGRARRGARADPPHGAGGAIARHL